MTEEDVVKQQAEEFARNNKKHLAKELTDISLYTPDEDPISIFMAGSPGAGKTEFSKALLALVEDDKKHKVVRIDADELRSQIPGYTGSNSYLFQGAISIIVDKVHDLTLDNKQSFILDGTFSKYEKAVLNIDRSIHKKRPVLIYYVYQNPEVAWKFTQSRELTEGRNIPKDRFIAEFLESRETVKRIHEKYKDDVIVVLIKKNFETHDIEVLERINSGEQIDQFIRNTYTKEDLEKLL